MARRNDLGKHLNNKLSNEGSLNEILRKFLFHYRSTQTPNLGSKSPHDLMTGRQMRTNLDLLKPTTNLTAVERNAKMKQQFNSHHGVRAKELQIGDKVFVKEHSSNNKWRWVSGEIVSKSGVVNYMQTKSDDDSRTSTTTTNFRNKFPKRDRSRACNRYPSTAGRRNRSRKHRRFR